jgi:AcrR family transcriptional regulator
MNQTAPTTTESRLLEAAIGLFASHGFAATSVRQVCDRAGANVAAVNYHFRSKRGLYDAAIDRARAESNARNPWVGLDANRDFWADDEPEVRLHRFVSMMLDHSLDEQGQPSELARVMIHEMLDPTEAFERQVEVSIRRALLALRDICRQVLEKHASPPADDERISRIALLISAQCMYPALVAGVADGLHPGVAFDQAGRTALAQLITSSALTTLRHASDD